MENGLKLCRDVVGMKVNYDTVVETSGVALPKRAGAKARLVLLDANDPFIGWIGLMQGIAAAAGPIGGLIPSGSSRAGLSSLCMPTTRTGAAPQQRRA